MFSLLGCSQTPIRNIEPYASLQDKALEYAENLQKPREKHWTRSVMDSVHAAFVDHPVFGDNAKAYNNARALREAREKEEDARAEKGVYRKRDD